MLTDGGIDFGQGPEPASVEFVGRCGDAVADSDMDVDKFTFAVACKHIGTYGNIIQTFKAYFFADFAVKRLADRLAEVDMAADSRIPFPRLYIFPFGTFLEIDISGGIHQMQMNHRMEQHRTAVALPSCRRADNEACLVDQRQNFF